MAHTNLLQEDRYTTCTTEKQRIQYVYTEDQASTKSHQHDEMPKFCVFIDTSIKGFHVKSLVPGAPNGTDWNLAHNVADQRPKARKKWDQIFFSNHGGVGVVKMKMIVFVASLKSGSFEKSGLLRYSFLGNLWDKSFLPGYVFQCG